MSAESTVLQGRAVAESLMADACTIRRKTGEAVDPDSGRVVVTFGDPFYQGPCRVRMMSGSGSDVHVLAQELSTQNQLIVCVPYASTLAESDDVVTVASSDPALDGRQLRVESFYGQTFSVERRYVCEESTTPDSPES